MCTPSQKLPFDIFSIVIASSKSRACSPSIVTVVMARKSVRAARSFSFTCVPSFFASAIDASPCASVMLYFRMMTAVSTPGASIGPSTSTIRPAAGRAAVGNRVISTVTISPAFALRASAGLRPITVLSSGAICTSMISRRSNGTT